MDALQQTVDALNAGQSGLDLKPLLFQYGGQSDIYRVALDAQGMLLSNSIQQGHPNEQMEKLRPYVNEQCAGDSAPAAAPPTDGAHTSAPASVKDFPWVEPPTVTETIRLGATDWARYPSQSDCEASAASASTLKTAADESDGAFAADQKGHSDAEITIMTYARKYVRALRGMDYPQPEEAVTAHWLDLCSTLSNSDPGQ
ncbi:hypothetical protein ABT030_47480 [Streptomyces mirabilis]|uniref:hypothetical protein n=1 Tax=Streptomyces mirabilis TaxID=68239 RepID=UPI003331602A